MSAYLTGRPRHRVQVDDAGPRADPDPVRRAAGLLWTELPMLLTGSVVVTLGWAVVRVLSPQLGVVTVLGLGLVVVPAFAALLHGGTVLLTSKHFGPRALTRSLWTSYRPTVAVTVVPMLTALLTVAATNAWFLHRQGWMLASMAAGLAVTLVSAAVGVIALPYLLRFRCPVREAWLVGGFVATRQPVPVLAVLCAVGLLVWAAGHVSIALLIIFPGPLALIWAAAVTAATDASRRHLDPQGHR